MIRIPVTPVLSEFPEEFQNLLTAPVYDSSCSPEARVWFLDHGDGLFLKAAPKGTLKTEAEMTAYFHSKGLGAEVLQYVSSDRDWLLTRRVPGEDCTHRMYLDDPIRLCDTTAALLRQLHETDFSGCPVSVRNDRCFAAAESNYHAGRFDPSFLPEVWQPGSAEKAWNLVLENKDRMKADVLLHGDYCLPNILLNDWEFSGFIDVGNGGIGDRHFDIFWGIWSLGFNLKTDAFRERFLDAYGRDKAEPEMLRFIAALESFGE